MCEMITFLTSPLAHSARKGLGDVENKSAFQKERMKSNDHNLAKLHAEIAADFGGSLFGTLTEMTKTHSNIVRIFQDKETKHWCIAILKTPDGEEKSHLEQVGLQMGFKNNYHSTNKNGGFTRQQRVSQFLLSLGFDRHPRCAIRVNGPAPAGFPKNPVCRSCLQVWTHATWDPRTTNKFTTHANGEGLSPFEASVKRVKRAAK